MNLIDGCGDDGRHELTESMMVLWCLCFMWMGIFVLSAVSRQPRIQSKQDLLLQRPGSALTIHLVSQIAKRVLSQEPTVSFSHQGSRALSAGYTVDVIEVLRRPDAAALCGRPPIEEAAVLGCACC